MGESQVQFDSVALEYKSKVQNTKVTKE